ncbi:MAG: alpha/beta hydrolase, partial [Clostridia bacterium]|nr:alpha/beta hydrolase [Clostridia bacterium]
GDSMRPIAESIASECKVYVPDFYGFGRSIEPSVPLTLDDYVDAVREIIVKLKLPDVYLVGHSFGARVAVRLASRYPQYVKGLVLIDGAGLKPRRGLRYYFKVFAHKTLKKLGFNGLKGSCDYRVLSPVMKMTFKNIVNEYVDGDLPYVTTKTLILWGAKDKATPLYMARRFKRKLPNAELKIFKGAGHFSYLDNFGESVREIKRYIGCD